MTKNKHKPSKEEKLYQNLSKTTKEFIEGKAYKPLSEQELITRLKIAPQHEEIFKDILFQLIEEKKVLLEKGKYELFKKKDTERLLTGYLHLHPRGFGFVELEKKEQYSEDIFIPKHLTLNAVHGDHVEVQVSPIVSEKGPEGKITAILSRGRTHIAGIIKQIEYSGDIVAHVPLFGASQRVVIENSSKMTLKVGDRVIMEVIEWGSKQTETVCQVTEILGHISDPSCDIKAAIAEFELRSHFPENVVEEAKQFGTRVSTAEISLRKDFRDLECFTIDPDTAKDFDDALTLTKDKKGHYHLGVHIADVSHYVRPGTKLDDEAKMRCNSTYFPAKCIPMLPSELSDNLCSLKANVNRLTVSVMMDFDTNGEMIKYEVFKSVIKSQKRFTYKEAKAVLDGVKKSPHLSTLQLMQELCLLLKKKRYERGSIEFALPELVVMVDDKGVPYTTDYIEYDVTHQLVEEFMLKANEVVATHLSKVGKNLTYRIHDEPSEDHMKDFSLLAQAFGFRLSEKPTSAEIQSLFDEALHTSYGPYLATSYIRRMRLATYSPDNIGHYGLGLTHYCHFTSPIRRYVDLVAHRILFGENDDIEELEEIADRCSTQERVSAKAEGSVVLLKKLRLLETYFKKDSQRQYEAVVTKVKNFGVYFEVLELMLEGFLHVSELDNDYFVFDEAKNQLYGKDSRFTYTAGDKMTVMLKEIDLILLESVWALVPNEDKPIKKREIKKLLERKPFKRKQEKFFKSKKSKKSKKKR